MTSPPHDLNGEEPARNDYRGDRAERHLTIRGYAARGGFGASSIRQPRGALNTMICAPPQLRPGTGVIGSYPASFGNATACCSCLLSVIDTRSRRRAHTRLIMIGCSTVR
jgi:hypothetical protein